MIDSKQGDVSTKSVKAAENIDNVEQALMQGPRKSEKQLSHQLNLGLSTYRIIQ